MIGRTVAPRQNLQSTSTETEHESNFKISTLQTIRNINHNNKQHLQFQLSLRFFIATANGMYWISFVGQLNAKNASFADAQRCGLNRGCACAGLPYLKQNQCLCVSVCPRMGRHLHKQMSTSPTRSVCTHV